MSKFVDESGVDGDIHIFQRITGALYIIVIHL